MLDYTLPVVTTSHLLSPFAVSLEMEEDAMETEDSSWPLMVARSPSHPPPPPPPPSPYCSPGGGGGGGGGGAVGDAGGGGGGGGVAAAGASAASGAMETAMGSTQVERYVSPHTQQISMAEYNQQAHHFTQQALRDLKTSTEYKQHTMRCHRCVHNVVEPLYNGHFVASYFVLHSNQLLLWERGPDMCPLLGGCSFLGGSFIGGSTVHS